MSRHSSGSLTAGGTVKNLRNYSAVVEFLHVGSGPEIEDIRRLFTEYGQSLNFNLCFQSFEDELHDLPGAYAAPRGRLMLARVDGSAAGCVALKPLDGQVCEMKRLYVRPQFRGRQLGRALASRVIDEARTAAYQSIRLDRSQAPWTRRLPSTVP